MPGANHADPARLAALAGDAEAIPGAVDSETDPRALEAIRKRSAFIASMGHELRTPLNTVVGYSEMLGEMAAEQGQGELARDLQRIHGAARRALGLVNDMVELLKLDAGALVLRSAPFAISELLDDIAAGARSIEAAGTRVELGPGAELGSVAADRLRVGEALLRLLEGAAGLNRAGTVTLSMEREAARGAGRVVIRVTNPRASISPRERERLLGDAFERPEGLEAGPWIERMRFGIARMLFRRMGGDATVEVGAGEGATFLAVLPAEPPAPGSLGERFYDGSADGGTL